MADRLVGSLFHCLSVAGKRLVIGKGLGGLPLDDEHAGLSEFWDHSIGGA